MKVLLATEKPFAKEAVEGIKDIMSKAKYELVILEKYSSKQELLDAIADVDAAIFRSDKFDKEVLAAAKKLKIAVRAGAGYDNIDLQAATDKNICVMNTPGQNANAVAELVIGLMIFAARNMYNGKSGFELKGKKLGIHAIGHVGQNVAKLAKAFDMDIYAYDPYVSDEVLKNLGVNRVNSIEDLYKTCQFVSLHIPATPETINSIGYNLLKEMPTNAILINTARQEVINEDEVLKLMKERFDFKYITDIQPKVSNLFEAYSGNRFFSTPQKMGAQTEEANVNAGIAAANQIVDFLENGNQKFRVNK